MADKMELDEQSEERAREDAAKRIQKLYKRATIKAAFSSVFWQAAWNQLDIDEENETVKTEDEINRMLENLQKRRQERNRILPKIDAEDRYTAPEPGYEGPIFEGLTAGKPLNPETATELIAFYRDGGLLPYCYANELVNAALKHFLSSPTVTEIKVTNNGRVTVVGDIHGQLEDLFTIFKLNGLPSVNNTYLFNGDFVDRGKFGIEVLFILYAFKLAFPSHVFLNRGNHEQRRLNGKYGFEDEVRRKYDSRLFDLIQQTFSALPLVARIEKKILVLHGGLFADDGVKISDLEAITRPRDLPRGTRKGDDLLLEDILWSDPRDITGREKSSRGAGIEFGADVTKAFLKDNHISLIIRSHELVEEGFKLHHDGRLITIFSCSNYCGTNDNFGAIIVFSDADLKPHFINYHAGPLDSERPSGGSRTRNDRCQRQTVKKLREKIYQNRHELLLCFSNIDTGSTGKITRLEWANALTSVLGLTIPWLKLRPYFTTTDEDGKINYSKFLEKYRVESPYTKSWLTSIVHKICKKIYRNSGDLSDAFKAYDKDGNGHLSYQEFTEAMSKCDVGLSNDQLYDLMKCIDRDGNNSIEYEEFISCFEVEFTHVSTKEVEYNQILTEIGETITKKQLGLKEAFKKFNKDGSRGISYSEFATLLEDLGLDYPEEKVEKIAEFVDTNKSNNISYREFKNAFKVSCKAVGWQEEIIQKMCSIFFSNRTHLMAAFRAIDVDNSGTIDVEEFRDGLETLNILKDYPLTDMQIRELFKSIDKDGDEEIAYDEFLKSFQLQSDEDDRKEKRKKSRSSSSKKEEKKKRHHKRRNDEKLED